MCVAAASACFAAGADAFCRCADFTRYGPYFRAWRQCYFAPGLLHLLCGALILFYGQDGPDGNQDDKVVGNKRGVSKEEARRNFLYGVLNYR